MKISDCRAIKTGESGAVIKRQTNAAGGCGDRDDEVRRAFGRAVADYEKVVVVADQSIRRRHSLAQRFSDGPDRCGAS